MSNETLKNLRDEFRNWYGMISIEELIENSELVEIIKKIERYFSFVCI